MFLGHIRPKHPHGYSSRTVWECWPAQGCCCIYTSVQPADQWSLSTVVYVTMTTMRTTINKQTNKQSVSTHSTTRLILLSGITTTSADLKMEGPARVCGPLCQPLTPKFFFHDSCKQCIVVLMDAAQFTYLLVVNIT